MELVTVHKYFGKCDVLHPDEKQFQYKFCGIPKDVCSFPFFTFDEEWRFDLDVTCDLEYTPLDFAIDLLAISKKYYFYSTSHEKIQKIIDYLTQNKEEQDLLFAKKLLNDAVSKREALLEEIADLEKRIKQLQSIVQEEK